MEPQDPEISSLEVDSDGVVTADARLVLACADCGTEMKEYNFSLQGDVSDEMKERIDNSDGNECEVEEGSSEFTDEYKYKGKKPIKEGTKVPFRFMTHMYGVTLNATVTCGDQEETIEISNSVAASSFDDLN